MKKNKTEKKQNVVAKTPIREVDTYTFYDAELDVFFKDQESLEQAKKRIREQTTHRATSIFNSLDIQQTSNVKQKSNVQQSLVADEIIGQNSMGIYFSGGRFFDTYKEMMEYKAAKISNTN